MKSKIFILSILAVFLVSCGVKMDTEIVKKLYVGSWERTNGEMMKYISKGTATWRASKIKDNELKKDYYLVEVSWKKTPWSLGDVIVQYLVSKKDNNVYLHGGTIGDTYYDSDSMDFQIRAMCGLRVYSDATNY